MRRCEAHAAESAGRMQTENPSLAQQKSYVIDVTQVTKYTPSGDFQQSRFQAIVNLGKWAVAGRRFCPRPLVVRTSDDSEASYGKSLRSSGNIRA